ncbi:L-fucose:H+ symporter permease [Pedobacter sp. MC2016-05]|uniref:L-fucose:H+ symporter permease n=1 Tax=Pedobacter sp. MC2016-05 TaxID=2994474 RepID=UPI002246FDC0|nr:L-fucose:H+ symporter permease [Pedobacter sp. MC2016-05]MCX2475312.1 L-fucose:H+ symporter permease [Pedobacter sp. MC2016-05]
MMKSPTESVHTTGFDHNNKSQFFALIIIISLFFFWGFVHNLDPVLIPHLKGAFDLSDLETALIDFSVFIAYFFMALPAGIFIKKFGYKNGMLLGLALFSTGAFLFIPSANTGTYYYFLAALFIIACGLAFLETAANPYVIALGNPKTATERLNFAQSFNGLAAFLAPIIGGKFILSQSDIAYSEHISMSEEVKRQFIIAQASTVKGPYFTLGVIILIIAILFFFIKLPEIKEEHTNESKAPMWHILKIKHLRSAVIAQFFYVGAQVCILSFFIRFASSIAELPLSEASWYAGGAGLAFMTGRFVGTFLMKFIGAHFLLICYALACVILTIFAILSAGISAVYGLIGISFFMSIMFPTIFSMGIFGLGKFTKFGSSLMVMSVVGGAILPLVMGFISDYTEKIQLGLYIPLLCFAVVLLFALRFRKPTID